LAKEAHGLALDLVPAAVTTARLATRRGDIRKASKVLEATWRLSPHAELAEAYAHVRTGDSAVDRLKRVKTLSSQRANTAEGALAIAKAAMEAREFDEARAQLKKVLQSEPARGAFLLMAELEDAETGDKGRMRDWLARAVKAPLDKAWIADGIVSAEWQAVSPVTGKLDAFRWGVPSGLQEEEGALLEDSLFEAPVLPGPAETASPAASQEAPVTVAPVTEAAADEPKVVELEAEPKAEAAPAEQSAEKVAPAPKAAPASAEPAAVAKEGYEGTTDDVRFAPALKDLPDSPSEKSEPTTPIVSEAAKDPEPPENKPDTAATPSEKAEEAQVAKEPAEPAASKEKTAATDDLNRPIEFPLSRMPDDPGTDDKDGDGEDKPARPRFFN
jgi:HemY protein